MPAREKVSQRIIKFHYQIFSWILALNILEKDNWRNIYFNIFLVHFQQNDICRDLKRLYIQDCIQDCIQDGGATEEAQLRAKYILQAI